MYRSILYDVKNGIARVTLNRPEKRNALNAEIIDELKAALAHSAADGEVRVVVVAGAGTDFCSGADLSAIERASQAGVLENLADARGLGELFAQMRHHQRPIVAAVKGRALAGGCGLATACDIILANESARFGYPEVNIGFVPAMVMAILRRAVPEKSAFELITMGEILPARRWEELGIVQRVYDDDQFDAGVNEYIARLASKSASAVSLSKSLLYHMDALSFDAGLEAGVQTNVIARMTDDCRRGIDKFLKR